MHDVVMQELRAFVRALARRPGFGATLIGILGLGVAANVVMFGALDALVLSPFPFPEPDRLVAVGTEMPRAERPLGYFERLSGPELVELCERSRTLVATLPFDLNSVRLRGDEFPVPLFAAFVWADPLATLGLPPVLGRSFTAAEIGQAAPVAVVSHALWRDAFGGSPDALGRSLVIDGTPRRVIGVAPPYATLYGADVFLPMPEPAARLPRARRQFNLMARLAPAADLAAANAELATLAADVEREHAAAHPEYRGWRLRAETWARVNSFSYRDELLLASGAALTFLLLVAANVATLLLTRAVAQRPETAVRLALGASRWRIARHALAQSALFATAGAALGLALAGWALAALNAWLPAELLAEGRPLALDSRALAFTVLAVLATALACGLAPTLQLVGTDLREALGAAGGRSFGGAGTRRAQRLFVATQTGLAVVLLAGAGLLTSRLVRVLDAGLGFDPEGLVSMRLTLPRGDYAAPAIPEFFDRLAGEVRALPGMEHVTLATQVAPATFFGAELRVEGSAPRAEGARPRVLHTVVGDDYPATLGLRLLRGRSLDARERPGAPPAAVINESAARRFFAGADPLGRRLRLEGSSFDSGWAEVVGVVADVRNVGLGSAPEPEVFTSHRQAGGRFNQLYLIARARGETAAVVDAIRRVVRRLDPEQPVYAIASVRQLADSQLGARRVAAGLLGAFAVLALLLAGLGVHGVVAFGVAARQRELGLRLALGASGRDIGRLVVGQALASVLLGIVCGLPLALGLARLLRASLGGLHSLDLPALVAPALVLLLAALGASAGPARRAARLSPQLTLRDSP